MSLETSPKAAPQADLGEGSLKCGIQNEVAKIWQEVLNRKDISLADDFFDLGGTSLDLIRVFSKLNNHFNINLNGSVLEEEATVRRMATCVEDTISH